jgi:predicted nucleic acid-binding protein
MSEPAFICVIDANIVLKLYHRQPGSEQADALFALLESSAPAQFYVPDLFYAECTNVFAQYARLTGYSAKEAQEDMTELRALVLHVVPTEDLAAQALEIALKQRVSGYDACYVALAQRIKAPLITADEKLVRSLAGKGYTVHSLTVFDIPPAPPTDPKRF